MAHHGHFTATTDQSGAITITLDPDGAKVQTYTLPPLRAQWLGIP